jgi:hypothetical protein
MTMPQSKTQAIYPSDRLDALLTKLIAAHS